MILTFVKTFTSTYKMLRKNKRIYESNSYYSNIDEIPLLNWWKCAKGELKYLWKETKEEIPVFFESIFEKMYYQLEYIDNTELRKIVEINYYENKFLITKDSKYKRKMLTKQAEFELYRKSDSETKLNSLLKFVQVVLNLPFAMDATTIKAGYFFSLYAEAIDKLDRDEQYGNN